MLLPPLGNRQNRRYCECLILLLLCAPGFVSTRWGTEMPAPIRWCVRALQVFGKSKEDCAEYMFKGLTQSKSGGFVLLNEYGIQINKVTSLHEEAKEYVFNHIMQIIDGGKAVAQPVSKQ